MELPRDQNQVTIGGGASQTDDTDVLPLQLDPATDYMTVEVHSDSVVPTNPTTDKRDQNHVPTMYGVSDADGVTPLPILTDDDGFILIDYLLT